MKKIFNLLLIAVATLGIATSCSDVPLPYEINAGSSASFGKKLPYKNASLSTFSTYNTIDNLSAWSLGSNYTQATGYQAWDGGEKFNKEVMSYLISPALNTNCESGKVRISFDQTIRYTNNVNGWANNHKVYISKDYDGNSLNFEKATWTELNYTPTASPYNDWTLYTSGYINVPEEFVNTDSVYVAFYFYAPSSASTTWELENFLIEEGDASDQNPSGNEEGTSSKESPLTVEVAKNCLGKTGYVTGYIVGYVDGTKLEEGATFAPASAAETELLLADYAECQDASLVFPVQLPVGELRDKLNPSIAENIGKKVIVYGSIETYFGVTGMKSTSWALLDDQSIGKDPEGGDTPEDEGTPTGDGTENNPYNAAAANAFAKSLSADAKSNPVYIKGKVSSIKEISTKYGNGTFYISDDGTTNGAQFYVFRCYDQGNKKFTDDKAVKVGDEVVIYGPVVNYMGNTPETVQNECYIYSINGATQGGDNSEEDQPSGSSDGIAIEGTTVTLTNAGTTAGSESVTIDFSTLGYENAATVETVTLSDGTIITFEAGTNSIAPRYYSASKDVRVYANNIITFEGKSTIASITMDCVPYNGTNGTGNATATLSADGNKLVYINASSSAGTQLRVKTITITYAK